MALVQRLLRPLALAAVLVAASGALPVAAPEARADERNGTIGVLVVETYYLLRDRHGNETLLIIAEPRGYAALRQASYQGFEPFLADVAGTGLKLSLYRRGNGEAMSGKILNTGQRVLVRPRY